MATSSRAAQRGGIFKAFRAIGGEDRVWWIKTLRWILFIVVAGVLLGALTFFILYRTISIPDPNAEFQTQTTKVYFSDGTTELGSFAQQDRESIELDQVPAAMQASIIAAEDRTFYSNGGIDFKGIVRALRNNATSDTTQGASTITQQYVKILYLTQEQTYTRKVKEAILSMKVDNQLSKSEILEGYLNTVYYGNGAYGVQVAAQTYFDKNAAELTVPESAYLATVVNSPSYYDPYTPSCVANPEGPECATETESRNERILPRYNYVLDGMESSGAITAAEADEFRDNLPAFSTASINDRYAGTNGYLLKMVENEMASLEFSANQVQGGGLRIVTTFDAGAQQAAVDAVNEVRPPGLDELHTALVSVEPGTGAVRALYGGPDFLASQINWATAGTQPGSTFKVFALIAGLEDGFGLQSQLNGSSPLKIGNGTVENQGDSGGASFGRTSLAFATAKSINTAFVDLTDQMSDGGDISTGATKILEAANQAGIPESTTEAIDPVAVTSLGYAPVAPVDMANAYATLAASGKRASWYTVQSVSSRKGAVLFEHQVDAEQSVPTDVAADALSALQGVTQSGGTGTSGRTVCPTAGKTGTATAGEAGDSRVSSSWFVGATPKLATAVMYNRGVGNEELEGYLRPFFGGTYPAQTFRAYMNAVVDENDCGTFPKPANIKPDKGSRYVPPPPSCGPGEQLNSARNGCVPLPAPTCPEGTQLDGSGQNCVPVPPPPPTCPEGQIADSNGNCQPATVEPCPPGQTGTQPNCTPTTGGNNSGGGTGGVINPSRPAQ